MDAVGEIKTRLSIEDVVAEYVQLKRAGSNFKGLSPFTSEKTPSFIVSPEKQIWHDFSSGKGGDVFSFVMEVEGLDFRGALELLARKAGVDLEKFQKSGSGAQSGKAKERLLQVLEAATKFYQRQMISHPDALDYISKKRKFSKETALEFRLGYSPKDERALMNFLVKKGFQENEIKLAGLATIRSRGLSDMFRGRIMVPLMDPFGKVIGFTARLLEDTPNAPKYINTPSTPLYDKSRHLFGFHLAKQAIRQEKFAVIAEGNLDVISSHQAGQKNVVCSAGTALTEMQLKNLSRLSGDVRLAFDEDSAGQAATERAIPIASKVGINLSVIGLPGGKDPDDLIRKDPALWEKALKSPEYAFDWLLTRYKNQLDLDTAEGKRRFSDVMLGVVRDISDKVEQEHCLKQIAKTADISPEVLKQKLSQSGSIKPKLKAIKNNVNTQISDKQQLEHIKITDRFLSLVLMSPGTRTYLDVVEPEMLTKDPAKKILIFLKENPEFKFSTKTAERLRDLSDYVKILLLQFEELYGDVDTLELPYEAARLRARIIEYFVKQQKATYINKLQNAPEKDEREVLGKVRDLDKLLKDIRED